MDSFSSKRHFDLTVADFQDQYYMRCKSDTRLHAIFQTGFYLASILYYSKLLRRIESGMLIYPVGISSFPLLQIYEIIK